MRFTTIAAQASGKVLDVPGGTSAEDVPIQQFHDNNGPGQIGSLNQQWIRHVADGGVDEQIISRLTGKGLRFDFAGLQQDMRPLHIFQAVVAPKGGPGNETWEVWNNADGSFCILSMMRDAQNGRRALDIPADALDEDQTEVQLWPYHAGDTQRFNFIDQDLDVMAMISRGDRRAWDVPGFSQQPGPLQQFGYHGGTNQLFTIAPGVFDAGPHAITSVSSGLTLGVDGGGALVQAAPTGGPEQQWDFVTATNESVIIRNRSRPGLSLDRSVNPVQIRLAPDAGGGSQEWWPILTRVLYQPLPFG
jgi:hypothetical protein